MWLLRDGAIPRLRGTFSARFKRLSSRLYGTLQLFNTIKRHNICNYLNYNEICCSFCSSYGQIVGYLVPFFRFITGALCLSILLKSIRWIYLCRMLLRALYAVQIATLPLGFNLFVGRELLLVLFFSIVQSSFGPGNN